MKWDHVTARRSLVTPPQGPAPVSQRTLLRQAPKVRAVCGSPARTDLRGGTSARAFPTATSVSAQTTRTIASTGIARRQYKRLWVSNSGRSAPCLASPPSDLGEKQVSGAPHNYSHRLGMRTVRRAKSLMGRSHRLTPARRSAGRAISARVRTTHGSVQEQRPSRTISRSIAVASRGRSTARRRTVLCKTSKTQLSTGATSIGPKPLRQRSSALRARAIVGLAFSPIP